MLVLIIGLPGSGKSYFAEALIEKWPATYLSSDRLRDKMKKRGQYDLQSKKMVYEEMLRMAEELLDQGLNVVVDASFYKERLREPFHVLTKAKKKVLRIIEIQADEGVIRKRIEKKRKYSEADFSVYQKIKAEFEPINYQHLILLSDQLSISEMVDKAIAYLELSKVNEHKKN